MSNEISSFSDVLHKSASILRRWYHTNFTKTIAISLACCIIFTVVAVCIDIFLPSSGWWMLLRTVCLIPLSAGMFIFGYTIALFLHFCHVHQTEPELDNEEEPRVIHSPWVSYRERLSVAWRTRISVVVFALGLLLVYCAANTYVYTFVSALMFATMLGIALFMRQTAKEQHLSELGLPDMRDIKFEVSTTSKYNARKQKAQDKKEQKKAKRIALLIGNRGRNDNSDE